MLDALRLAAKELLTPAPPAPRRRRRDKSKGGGKGRAFITARGLADDYLNLCKNPVQDLHRWLAEDRKRSGHGLRLPHSTTRKGQPYAHTPTQGFMANANRLCRQPLPALRGRLDAQRHGGRGADGVSARSGAGAGGNDGLRSFRGEGSGSADAWRIARSAGGFDDSFDAEAAGIAALFRVKLASLQRYMRPRDIAAAVRALRDEKQAAMKALHERRTAKRQREREARHRVRGAPLGFGRG